jgi:hypothetical protein
MGRSECYNIAPLAGVDVGSVDARHIWTTTTLADGSFKLLVAP